MYWYFKNIDLYVLNISHNWKHSAIFNLFWNSIKTVHYMQRSESGLPTDALRRKYRWNLHTWNSLCAQYSYLPFSNVPPRESEGWTSKLYDDHAAITLRTHMLGSYCEFKKSRANNSSTWNMVRRPLLEYSPSPPIYAQRDIPLQISTQVQALRHPWENSTNWTVLVIQWYHVVGRLSPMINSSTALLQRLFVRFMQYFSTLPRCTLPWSIILKAPGCSGQKS